MIFFCQILEIFVCERELPKEAIQIDYLPIVFENASKSASEYLAT
jgi:hypothetical protein